MIIELETSLEIRHHLKRAYKGRQRENERSEREKKINEREREIVFH